MKNLILSAIILLLIINCRPPKNPFNNTEIVKLNATINNTNENITLGDTLKITLKLPDSVINTTGGIQLVNTLQMGQFFMSINKEDTINKKAELASLKSYWTTQGTISINNAFSYSMNTNVKPYGVVINFKPTSKGIYYFEVISQPGQLKLNGGYDASLVVGFNVINKHIDIITPFVTAGWVTEANTRQAGIYVFRVI